MIDELIQKQVEEYRKKFTFGGKTGIVALKTDNAMDIEAQITHFIKDGSKKRFVTYCGKREGKCVWSPMQFFGDKDKCNDCYKEYKATTNYQLS